MSLSTLPELDVRAFNGLMTLPASQSQVPKEYAVTCFNCKFTPGSVSTRPGVDLLTDYGAGMAGVGAVKSAIMNITSPTAQIYTWLGTDHQWRTNSGFTKDLTALSAAVIHFKLAQYFNLAFLTYGDGHKGVITACTWTPATNRFSGVGLQRKSAAPTTAVAAAAGGSVTPGLHKIAILYESASGFRYWSIGQLTLINGVNVWVPEGNSIIITAGTQTINVTNIPAWTATSAPFQNSDCVKRYVCMTAAGLDTYFIVATINNNTAGGAATINVDDLVLTSSGLQDCTKYFSFFDSLPAMAGCVLYGSRMVYWGDPAQRATLYISDPNDPESVRADTGFVYAGANDGQGITNCAVQRGVLYIIKEASTWATYDTGDVPSNWPAATRVIGDVGSYSYSGVGQNSDNENLYIADMKGLYEFNGSAPVMLSRIILPTWQAAAFPPYTTEVTVDTRTNRVYCIMAATALVWDFLEPKQPKWDVWGTNGDRWSTILVDVINQLTVFFTDATTGGRYLRQLTESAPTYVDVLGAGKVPIAHNYRTGAIFASMRVVTMFEAARFEAFGLAVMYVNLYGLESGGAAQGFFNGNFNDVHLSNAGGGINVAQQPGVDDFSNLSTYVGLTGYIDILPVGAVTPGGPYTLAIYSSSTLIRITPPASPAPVANYPYIMVVRNVIRPAPTHEQTVLINDRFKVLHFEFGHDTSQVSGVAAGTPMHSTVARLMLFGKPDGGRMY